VDSAPDFDVTDEELRAAGSIKWTLAGPEVLPAWVAEMDVRGCPVVTRALREAVDRGSLGYPARDLDTGLPRACADFLARRFRLTVDPERVVLTGDVMAGIRLVLDTLCDPAAVVVPVPTYPPFLTVAPLTGRHVVQVPFTLERGRAALDREAIADALAAGARTILLSQPHNPTGRAFTVEELTGIRDLALRYGARVISDEIHAPLLLSAPAHVPYASIEGTADHVTTVLAATKAWNAPGVKSAQIIAGSTRDLARLRAVPHVANHGTSVLGIAASIAAYRDGEPWLDAVLEHLRARRDQFASLLADRLPGIGWTPGEATYLAWLDARAAGVPDPAGEARRRGRVLVNPGSDFGTGFDGFVRFNFATSAERLDRLVDALARAWPAAT
jgi:cystathionine beta-lyase